MKNKDKLKFVSKNHVRYHILYYGSWQGVIRYHDLFDPYKTHLVMATLTNIASLQDKNILELYKICA